MAASSVSSFARPGSFVNLRKSFPPQSSVILSFWALSLTPIESASRFVCSYHSSNFSRYFEGSHGFPAVASAASMISVIVWCYFLSFKSSSPV